MRCLTRGLALTALALVGGCANAPPQDLAARGRPVAERSPPVPCSTADLLVATVSKCGSGGLRFGVAGE